MLQHPEHPLGTPLLLVYSYYPPFHDDQQAPVSHEDVLVDIDEVDNVGMGAGAPVKVNLATRLGNITKNL